MKTTKIFNKNAISSIARTLTCLTGLIKLIITQKVLKTCNKQRVKYQCLGDNHGLTIQQYVWLALLASFPYLDASEETGPQGTDLLGYWP